MDILIRSALCIMPIILLTQMPVSAKATPPEIVARCAEEWATDYRMQLWCREKQMEALDQLQRMDGQTKTGEALTDQPADDDRPVIWAPFSGTAIRITGAIRTSQSAIDFENGERIEIEAVSGGKSEHRQLFKVTGQSNPPLIYGNRLCADDEHLSYVMIDTSASIYGLSLKTYCNTLKPPLGDFKWGAGDEFYYASYGYSKAAEQRSWRPSVNIEEQREVAAIETYCSEVASYDADPPKWRKCIDGEMAAGLKIREMLDGKPVDDGRYLLSNCFGYINAHRNSIQNAFYGFCLF